IICERCGKIVEFNSEELERQQERIARFLGFVVSRHRMELYGICSDCREGRKAAGAAGEARGIPRGSYEHRGPRRRRHPVGGTNEHVARAAPDVRAPGATASGRESDGALTGARPKL